MGHNYFKAIYTALTIYMLCKINFIIFEQLRLVDISTKLKLSLCKILTDKVINFFQKIQKMLT